MAARQKRSSERPTTRNVVAESRKGGGVAPRAAARRPLTPKERVIQLLSLAVVGGAAMALLYAMTSNTAIAVGGAVVGVGLMFTASLEAQQSIASAIFVFLVIRTFIIEAYRIPSGSMEPTLLVGDFLFVSKLNFGPHVPLTSVNLPGWRDPRRGEVVIFQSPPQDPSIRITPEEIQPIVVKRLVGVGGDTIYMRQGRLYVNGIEQRYANAAAPDPMQPDEASPLFDWQHKYEVRGSRFPAPPATPTHDNWGPFLIPPRHYFAMGDNRYNSIDARYYGIVPRENVRGKPLFVYYSFDPSAPSPIPFVTHIRWGRLGTRIR